MIRWGKETYEALEIRIDLRRKKEEKRVAKLVISEKRHVEVLKRIIEGLERKLV